jgi:hypothetical protein
VIPYLISLVMRILDVIETHNHTRYNIRSLNSLLQKDLSVFLSVTFITIVYSQAYWICFNTKCSYKDRIVITFNTSSPYINRRITILFHGIHLLINVLSNVLTLVIHCFQHHRGSLLHDMNHFVKIKNMLCCSRHSQSTYSLFKQTILILLADVNFSKSTFIVTLTAIVSINTCFSFSRVNFVNSFHRLKIITLTTMLHLIVLFVYDSVKQLIFVTSCHLRKDIRHFSRFLLTFSFSRQICISNTSSSFSSSLFFTLVPNRYAHH